MKIISIVLPVYNAAGTIRRCLESILAQDDPFWELLAVDDGSSDDSLEILQSFAAEDSRIRVFNIPNGGPSRARNVGIDHASGEYVCFVDADDYVSPDYLSALRGPFQENNVQLVCGSYFEISPMSSKPVPIKKLAGLPAQGTVASDLFVKALFKGTTGLICSKLYITKLLNTHKVRFRECLNLYEDLIFSLEYCRHIERIAVVERCIYYYIKTRSSSLSASRDISLLRNTEHANELIAQLYNGDDKEDIIFDRTVRSLTAYTHSEAVSDKPISQKIDHIMAAVRRYDELMLCGEYGWHTDPLSNVLLRSGRFRSYIAWRNAVQHYTYLKHNFRKTLTFY